MPCYSLDPLVRRAPALARMPGAEFAVRLHPDQAAELGLADGDCVRLIQGEAQAETHLFLDARVAVGAALIPAAVPGSEGLGAMMGPVGLERLSGRSAHGERG